MLGTLDLAAYPDGHVSTQADHDTDAGRGLLPGPGVSRPSISSRSGTGEPLIITQPPVTTSPIAALTLDPSQPVSATTLGLPQSTTSHSTGLSRPVGKPAVADQPTLSQTTGSRVPVFDGALIGEDSIVSQPLDGGALQHVWGAALTQSHWAAADDSMRGLPGTMSPRSTKKKREAEFAVTPRTLHK